jgi:hypothetical protein
MGCCIYLAMFLVPIGLGLMRTSFLVKWSSTGVAIALFALCWLQALLPKVDTPFHAMMPFTVAASAAARHWLLPDKPVYPSGHCRKCGYNLTGNVSGVCPECGNVIEN